MPLRSKLQRGEFSLACFLTLIVLSFAGSGQRRVQAEDVQFSLGESFDFSITPCTPQGFTASEAVELASWQTSPASLVSCEAYPCDGDGFQPQPDCCSLPACESCAPAWLDNLSFFAGLDGSKQPQDYGVNANLGGRASFNWGVPVSYDHGIGLQVGSAVVGSGNAVRVYELMGEDTDRIQSYTTVGFYQRLQNGFSWGAVYDFLYQDSYDQFALSQYRGRVAYDLDPWNQFGMTLQLSGERDTGFYNATQVTLDPITQGSLYWRRMFESGTQATLWAGLAEGHGESNAALGYSPPTDEVFLFGADILAPLNDYLAIYGETNIMLPADTGTVDAFLGLEFYPWGGAYRNRRAPFSPLLPVAGCTSFSVDLSQ